MKEVYHHFYQILFEVKIFSKLIKFSFQINQDLTQADFILKVT